MSVSEKSRERALSVMKPGREYTTGDLVTLAGFEEEDAKAVLKSLRYRGFLRSEQTNGNDRITLYRLA